MNIFLKREWIISLIMVFILNIGALPSLAQISIHQKRPSIKQWCFDYVDVFSLDVEREINNQGRGIQKTFDVDFVVAVIPTIEGQDIVEYTVDLFSRWEIGKSTQGKKGILILIAKKEQKVRIEIGYDLEAIYTDAYIGQVEREILKEFFEQAEWDIGILATIENFLFRIYNKDLMEEVKGISSPEHDLKYYSQGAGASNVFDFGAALKKSIPETPREIREYFVAQPTPELAFIRYMELLSGNIKDRSLDLFTDLSKFFYKNWKSTSGQRRAEVQKISGKPYIIKQTDTHAIIMFPDPKMEVMATFPIYLIKKSEEGWQMDINAMTRLLRVLFRNYVHLRGETHPYSELIMQEYNYDFHGTPSRWDDDKGCFGFQNLGIARYTKENPGHPISIELDYKKDNKTPLKDGDRILTIDGQEVNKNTSPFTLIKNAKVGDVYKFKILRNNKKITLDVVAQKRADYFQDFRKVLKTPRIWLGIYVADTVEYEYDLTHSSCAVLEVAQDSPADKAGLKSGDVIISIDGKIGEPYWGTIRDLVPDLKAGDKIIMEILRGLKERKTITIITQETNRRGYF